RTALGDALYVPESWDGHLLRVSIGGAILLVSVITYVVIIVRTVMGKPVPADEVPQVPIAESLHDAQNTPAWLDRFKPWLIGAAALLLIAYGPQLVDQIVNMNLNAPGFKPW
ncbi:MAG: hypothetical protein KDB16_03460, partial [Acidimicrobiales bacterium]|nr:hypothetical protein [Acidimicrobiales bacterium]